MGENSFGNEVKKNNLQEKITNSKNNPCFSILLVVNLSQIQTRVGNGKQQARRTYSN